MISVCSYRSLFILALSLLSTIVSAQNICPLCATPADLPTVWDEVVPGDSRTCRQIYLLLGDIPASNALCQPTKDVAQDFCCNGSPGGGGGNSAPVGPRPYTGPVGNEPVCPICGTMEYPGIPNAFIVARYVGEYTCDQLYGRGLNGMTPDFMCGPLQDFARPVCGCGEFNPSCRNNPNLCWGQPGYNGPGASPPPPPAPVSQPVQPPVSMPVAQPTNAAPAGFNRKTPPQGGKYSTKLSNSRGGAAQQALRGGRRGEEVEHLGKLTESLPEQPENLKFDFKVVERDESV